VNGPEEFYEITVVHHREGLGDLKQTICCDAEMAVSWLATVAHEIAETLPAGESPTFAETLNYHGERRGKVFVSPQLRAGRHVQSLYKPPE
jgi:hypothetical protein